MSKDLDTILTEMRMKEMANMKDDYKWAHIYNARHIDDIVHYFIKVLKDLDEIIPHHLIREHIDRFERMEQRFKEEEEITVKPFTGGTKCHQ